MPYLSVSFTKNNLLDFVIPDATERGKLGQAVIHAKLTEKALLPLDELCRALLNQPLPLPTYQKDDKDQFIQETSNWRAQQSGIYYVVTNQLISSSQADVISTTIRCFYDDKNETDKVAVKAFLEHFRAFYQGGKPFTDGVVHGPYINGVLLDIFASPAKNPAACELAKPPEQKETAPGDAKL